jgi:multiple sugar transport system ATP-binding protein
MATVTLESVTKVYPNGYEAVHELDLAVGEGEFLVLVGPSGCGKTTALRMVAGLEEVTAGVIRICDRVVNDEPPGDRDIAMVFQNYALYPHMTVAGNIAFGLRMRHMPKDEIRTRVAATAHLLGLSEWIDRKPAQLSGGQRQRVAMGRAIVREPSVFLMDEPLSNLDAKLRVQMRAEVARIQRRLDVATLYVTHDQVEAMTMGDRVAVLSGGVLQQVASPQELYERPGNLFVAGFMGSPAMNFFEGVVDQAIRSIKLGSQSIDLPDSLVEARPGLRRYAGKTIVVGIRPEHLPLRDSEQPGWAPFEGDVDLVEALGAELLVHFTTDARAIEVGGTKDDEAEALSEGALARRGAGISRIEATTRVTAGQRVRFYVSPDRMHYFDPATTASIDA